MKIDYVFPYVTMEDPCWVSSYNRHVGKLDKCRYRDNGLLKYKIISIEKNMPWVNSIVMIVSNETQVPSWVDRSKIRIVTHAEFIPKEFLPTFNSCTIEMFLHNIPGLSEIFIYSNDDIFITGKCNESDFYSNGPKGVFNKIIKKGNTFFERNMSNQWHYICKIHNKPSTSPEIRPAHIDSVMSVKYNRAFYTAHKTDIHKSITKTRSLCNFNQYLYTISAYMDGNTAQSSILYKYYNMNTINMNTIDANIKLDSYNITVFNDNEKVTDDNIANVKKLLRNLFEPKVEPTTLELTTKNVSIKSSPDTTPIKPTKIDYVFPYVTMNDDVWLSQYRKYNNSNKEDWNTGKERFRDNGLLKYLFRALETNLPWVNKIHMIVSNIEQVPSWLNREHINIILHKDFMPMYCLPTFNSSTIEMFLPNLRNIVSSMFIYSNDDLIPFKPISKEFFIKDNKLCYNITERAFKHTAPGDIMRRNDYNLINNIYNSDMVVTTQHGPIVYNMECINECFSLYESSIINSCSKFRTDINLNQYMYAYYQLKKNIVKNEEKKILSLVAKTNQVEKLCQQDLSLYDFVCINDYNGSTDRDWDKIIGYVNKYFPKKSKYEI